MARLFELRGEHLARFGGGDGERDQGGRHVLIQEGAGHGVLAANGRAVQPQLGVQRPQQGLEGLAPARRVLAQLFKILLEGQVSLPVVRARRHQLGH